MTAGFVTHTPRDQHARPILTVGQLREILAHVDADTHVVLATADWPYWYVNVESVIVPGEDGDGYLAVTLYPGFPYDSRQT